MNSRAGRAVSSLPSLGLHGRVDSLVMKDITRKRLDVILGEPKHVLTTTWWQRRVYAVTSEDFPIFLRRRSEDENPARRVTAPRSTFHLDGVTRYR